MYQNITFKTYLSKILIIFALFVFLPMVLSPLANNTTSSYITSCVCFFIITIVSVKLILGDKKYIKYYAFAFIIQIIIGLIHYLVFVDPHYFQTDGSGSLNFQAEYLSVFNAIDRLNKLRNSYGILSLMEPREFEVAHAEIWHLISLPFYYLQHKWLNYASLNTFSSLIASINVVFWYRRSYEYNVQVEKSLLFWTAYFPTFLLNGMLWRDPFGVCLISIGLVLVGLSSYIAEKAISFVVLGMSAFLQRTVYLLFAGVSSFWGYIKSTKSTIIKILYIVLGAFLLVKLGEITDSANGEDYNRGYVNAMSVVALPIKIIFGMIGPFPWTNFYRSVQIDPAYAWQLQDYLMGTFQFGLLITVITQWKNLSFKELDAVTVMGFGIMLSGFVSRQMHIGYISEGLYFILPWFFSQVQDEYKKYLKSSFIILLFLNILLLAVGNIGINSLWK